MNTKERVLEFDFQPRVDEEKGIRFSLRSGSA